MMIVNWLLPKVQVLMFKVTPHNEKAALLVSIVDLTTEKKVCQVCYQALTRGTKCNALEVEYASA
jgi:hypothetical protein